ncbi:hypothetical protein, partial [Vibrio vulnificus]|uniref:hypothetical protein n=1 Tax=Vibrio vulnificus TaxID=672 RepID=UPI0019D440E5
PLWMQVQTFYNGHNMSTRQNINAATGGTLSTKTPEGAWELFEGMTTNKYQKDWLKGEWRSRLAQVRIS